MIASTIWSPTVNTGFSAVIGSWKIMAMSLPRIFRKSFGSAPINSLPSKVTLPVTTADLGSSPMMASEVTDFPEPDSPTTASTSPGRTSKLVPRTAVTSPSSPRKVTDRSLTARTGSVNAPSEPWDRGRPAWRHRGSWCTA